MTPPGTRLYALVARDAPLAVVLRRGPTRQFQLLTWDLATDEVTPGQWFKGRIYERRCDLSPSGRYLVYFAAKHKGPFGTWTAVSRPPFLTALALWPNLHSGTWGGGGLFESDRRLLLNHYPFARTLADGFVVPPRFEVGTLGDPGGGGEDAPVEQRRMLRDGWTRVEGRSVESSGNGLWIRFDPPLRWRRPIGGLVLERATLGIKATNGPWYLERFRLLDGERVVRDLGVCDWADAGAQGDLLVAWDGRLWRAASPTAALREVADLRNHRFEARKAPAWATVW
jgi:hypothetical protein